MQSESTFKSPPQPCKDRLLYAELYPPPALVCLLHGANSNNAHPQVLQALSWSYRVLTLKIKWHLHYSLKKKKLSWMARWFHGERCLMSSLTTWDQAPGPVERMSQLLQVVLQPPHTVTHMHTNIDTYNINKNVIKKHIEYHNENTHI